HVRAYDDSRRVLTAYLQRHGSGPYASAAKEFASRLEARFSVNPKAVGVLVPLSGRFKPFGERSLEAIKIAFAKTSGIELVVKDTEANANVTTAAVEQLVLEHNVIAIIGPLFSSSALAAAQKAEELSVPLLALSYRDGIPEIGPWVFRTGLTVEAQAKGLAKVAFDELGFTRFALMWPRSRYGVAFATAFWKEVEQRKGEIKAAEAYEHDQTTFRSAVRRMVGRYYLYGRWDYRQKLSELRAMKLPSHRFKAAVEKLQKELPPIVDFDAIIIPDTGKNIGLIAPALAVEDIVMTRDPKMLEKIKKATGAKTLNPVTLMGGSTWNHPQTPESCDRYCNEAIFVDAYYPDNPETQVRDFVSEFRDAVGADPVLIDAQAYDTARLLAGLLG
ncbi:MAG: penicillin-binding protein activator, partial [Myxococcota bacterium]